jgi:hypothetical protein
MYMRANRCYMPDPTFPDPTTSGDRLRSTESDRAWQAAANRTHSFPGLQELDKALVTDRLTSYSAKKMWSDPLARFFLIVGATVIFLGWAYLAMQ